MSAARETGATSFRVAIGDVARTARLAKIAPVPILAWSGYALAHGHDAVRLGWVTIAVVAVTLLVTRLNVLTDESLDRATRPELARSLRRSAPWMVLTSALEGAALVTALVLVSGRARVALIALLVFGALYSYNFFSGDPVRTRWKAHWAGHALAFVGSYVALWSAGAGVTTSSRMLPVVLVGLSTGIADYAVYVGECAIDHEEEASAGLRTSAAVLGPRASSLVALALFGIGTLLHGIWLTSALALAFVPPLVLRGVMLAALAAAELGSRPRIARALRLRGADGVFLAARIWTFLVLAIGAA